MAIPAPTEREAEPGFVSRSSQRARAGTAVVGAGAVVARVDAGLGEVAACDSASALLVLTLQRTPSPVGTAHRVALQTGLGLLSMSRTLTPCGGEHAAGVPSATGNGNVRMPTSSGRLLRHRRCAQAGVRHRQRAPEARAAIIRAGAPAVARGAATGRPTPGGSPGASRARSAPSPSSERTSVGLAHAC